MPVPAPADVELELVLPVELVEPVELDVLDPGALVPLDVPVPEVPALPPVLICAFVSRKVLLSLLRLEVDPAVLVPLVPVPDVVPVGVPLVVPLAEPVDGAPPPCRQPVTVTVWSPELWVF
jgi:hypothetical protein